MWAELAEQTMGELDTNQREIVMTALEQANDRLRDLVGDAVLAEE